jgi:outer membrane putative beta-barrel porin/alpha-amylase
MMRCWVLVLVGMLIWLSNQPAWALDHDNLDKNRPVQIEDAYPIAKGEIALEGGARFVDQRQGKTRFVFQPQVLYGAFYNTQLEIGGDLLTEPTTVEGGEKSGDLRLGALYNFNTETLTLLALAVKFDLELPTGVRSKGVDGALTGILTRSFGRWRTHLNAAYTVVGSAQGRERNGFYRLVAGVSYPLGYPTRFRQTLIADVFTRQSDLSGGRNPTGVEAGLRFQLSSRIVLDGGIGTEFAGPPDRSAVFGTLGLSVAF